MIITRSPLRISLGGGGTDLSSYYSKEEGFLIAAAINKYVYISLNENFNDEIILKYSTLEKSKDINAISHPIFRECIRKLGLKNKSLEIASMADIPAGTGLGSSGSFTTSLLKALNTYKGNLISAEELAEEACAVEIDILNEPIGKQDQYIASYGGLRCFKFNKDGKVDTWQLDVSKNTLQDLEENLLLFFTGVSRSASVILKDQKQRSEKHDKEIIKNLNEIKKMGLDTKKILESGNMDAFAEIMNEHWKKKKQRSKDMSNQEIDELYDIGINNGARSGKIIGAGGGGFLMFYASDKLSLRNKMKSLGIREVKFNFDYDGTKSITNE
tara:strand:+ start:1507 stop:2490 length:984 start_codon:yes stop_codon:yes gene_type:complete